MTPKLLYFPVILILATAAFLIAASRPPGNTHWLKISGRGSACGWGSTAK
jgi:hypothetical protein